MIEQVINRRNVMRAYRAVVSNKGSAGVDGMSVKELYAHLVKNRAQVESDIRHGKYLPHPIQGVEIPESNGKKRLLGVPTVTDRMLQQAVGQVLAAKYETEFDDFSIYVKSESIARKTGNSIYLFLRDKLKLPITGRKAASVNL